MTVSADNNSAKTTLKALNRIRNELGCHTSLGVSNVSFGLPNRPMINAYFYAMAMQSGLTAGIINPSSEMMMNAYRSYCALMNHDKNCQDYIEYCSQKQDAPVAVTEPTQLNLQNVIEKGLKEEAGLATKDLLTKKKPLDIIQEYLIPALDKVGKGFEQGTIFLPQLLMSAEAAKQAFEILKEHMSQQGDENIKKEKILLATVKGDIHDIGKNIVKVLLENYGFEVVDLGKDVAPERIVETVCEQNIRLVGLSALMTTTVVGMEETIRQLRDKAPTCKVMVGGAVLNQEYADMIHADFYGKDAMQSVYYAQKVFAGE
jgi:5-methyltetrahydrofolate--homocysteine methyltransferase